jgi:hypothetical protein
MLDIGVVLPAGAWAGLHVPSPALAALELVLEL